MSNQGKSGCRVAAFILAGIMLVFGLVVGGVFWMFKQTRNEMRDVEVVARTVAAAAARDETVRLDFDASAWDSLKPLEEGQPVGLGHFILAMEDPRATELSRNTFRERADGAPVTWRLTVQNVGEGNGVIVANLLARYAFQIEGGMSGSSLMVQAEFDESQRDALIGLRQEDRVTVSGKLALSGDEIRITEAHVVTPE